MFGSSTRALATLYLLGLFAFGFYSIMGLGNPSLLGAVAFGAKWPALVLHVI